MTSRLRWKMGAAVALAVSITPAAAQAATKTVFMGTPPPNKKAFEPTRSDVNAFFPSNVAVHVGDTVAFTPVGFHTLHLPKAGSKPTELQIPSDKAVSGVKDEAGVPYWFNGLTGVTFNPVFFMKSGFGKTAAYAGRTEVLSGLPVQRAPKPAKVRFTKAGLYKYFCDLHPGMSGTVRVAARSKTVASASADAARVRKQAISALTVAKSILKTNKPPANTIQVGAAGKGGVEFFGMIPSKLTVPRGTTVTFQMAKRSSEIHTAAFGPGAGTPDKKTTFIGGLAAAFEGDGDPRVDYPSEAPGTPPAILTPLLHGNGFWNTGIMDSIAQSPPPASGKVIFGTPGTYKFVCLVHTFMKGTITVQ